MEDVDGLEKWNVENVNNMSDMFNGCSTLTNVNGLEKWKVSNVTNTSYMFSGCKNLEDVDDLKKMWIFLKTGNMKKIKK